MALLGLSGSNGASWFRPSMPTSSGWRSPLRRARRNRQPKITFTCYATDFRQLCLVLSWGCLDVRPVVRSAQHGAGAPHGAVPPRLLEAHRVGCGASHSLASSSLAARVREHSIGAIKRYLFSRQEDAQHKRRCLAHKEECSWNWLGWHRG